MDHEVQQIGDDVFRRRYRYHSYKGNQPQTLAFPKEILSQAVHETAEFHEQEMLYYYLTWTCKMQLIDGEFRHYHFKNRQPNDIAIFNTELHERCSPHSVLYVVAVLNARRDAAKGTTAASPKWRMVTGFMTAQHISNKYTVNEHHLPEGSRQKRHFFKHDMESNALSLYAVTLVSPNWRRVQRVCSQKRKNWIPQYRWQDVESAVDAAMKRVRSGADHSERAPLIPILHIDMNTGSFFCESLLPIQIQRSGQSKHWAAVSLQGVNNYQSTVHKLYVDVQDIVQKATLVDPNAARSYQWLYSIGDNNNNNKNNSHKNNASSDTTSNNNHNHHNNNQHNNNQHNNNQHNNNQSHVNHTPPRLLQMRSAPEFIPSHMLTSRTSGSLSSGVVDVKHSLVSHVMGAMEAFQMEEHKVNEVDAQCAAAAAAALEEDRSKSRSRPVSVSDYVNLELAADSIHLPCGPPLPAPECILCKQLKEEKTKLELRLLQLENENLFKDVRIKALEDEVFKLGLNVTTPPMPKNVTTPPIPADINGIPLPVTPPMPSIHDDHVPFLSSDFALSSHRLNYHHKNSQIL
mmetsp:Transcript_17660/g.27775  ORF Transcript_17660/g.27775 Transcript_17660/m.27775 type:complete len:574 (+) Transcript_17660:124-1845(+)